MREITINHDNGTICEVVSRGTIQVEPLACDCCGSSEPTHVEYTIGIVNPIVTIGRCGDETIVVLDEATDCRPRVWLKRGG